MKEFDEKMTDKIRDMLVGYEAEYSPEAWESFSTQLDQANLGKSSKRKWWYLGIGGTLFVAILVTFTILISKENKYKYISDQSVRNRKVMKQEELPRKIIEGSSSSFQENVEEELLYSGSESVLENEYKNNSSKSSEVIDEPKTSHDIQPEGEALERLLTKKINTISLNKNSNLKLKDVKPLVKATSEKAAPNKQRRKKHPFRFELPNISLKRANGKAYKNFVGPNKVSVYWNPEIHKSSEFPESSQSLGVGFFVEGPLRERLGTSIGINFQKNSLSQPLTINDLYEQSVDAEEDFTDIRPLNPDFLGDSLGVEKSADYQFLEIPLTLKLYLMESERSRLNIQLGMSALIFLKEDYFIPFINRPNDKIYVGSRSFKAFDNIHFAGSANFGIGYQYNLSSRLSLSTSFNYKYGLRELGGLPQKLTRMSFRGGITYRFGRKD